MPIVAGPAVVIGVTAALWYTTTLLFDFTNPSVGRLASGFVFGLGVFLLLHASHSAPIAPVVAHRWRRSLVVGLLYAAAFWFVGALAFGPMSGWVMAAAGGLTALLADRRTAVDKTIHDLYRFVLAIALLGALGEIIIAWIVEEHPYIGIGTAGALLVAAFAPIANFPKWTARLFSPLPAISLQPAPTQNLTSFGGYQTEALAFCAFLAPEDIPRSLVISVALEVGKGRATELRSLAPRAFIESGSDSLSVDPLIQRFAIQRMAIGERKAWAGRAVRTLAAHFPVDYAANMPWCERLAPHAIAAASHAREQDVEQGASALLLNHVAGYLILSGRPQEAAPVLELALTCARRAFGQGSPEVATVHANLAQANRRNGDPTVEATAVGSFAHTDSTALALDYAQLGDVTRDSGDLAGARRNYHAALGHAKHALGGKHVLVADLRSRLAALPPDGREKIQERHLLVGGLAMIVLAAAVFVGVVLWREARIAGPRPSANALSAVEELREVCADRQRYYPDAAAFSGSAPHPIQLFTRSVNDSTYLRENLFDPTGPLEGHWQADDTTVRSVQLVGCVTQRDTGPEITVCKVPGRPDIPLHQATYEVAAFEAKTGRKVSAASMTVVGGSCPPQYAPPADDRPWRLYALPSFQHYEEALGRVVEQETVTPPE